MTAYLFAGAACLTHQMEKYPDEVVERFWALVDRGEDPDGCWTWTGPVRPDGYGVFNSGPRLELAHRLALTISSVEIPPDHVAMQVCRNRLCCHPHPNHVRVATRRELMAARSRTRGVPRPERRRDPDED